MVLAALAASRASEAAASSGGPASPGLAGEARPSEQGAVALADLEELLVPGERVFAAAGILLLDTADVPTEDHGFVRRFLERHAGWRMVLLGQEAEDLNRSALARFPRTRGLVWPPDLEQLGELLDPSGTWNSPGTSGPPEPPRAPAPEAAPEPVSEPSFDLSPTARPSALKSIADATAAIVRGRREAPANDPLAPSPPEPAPQPVHAHSAPDPLPDSAPDPLGERATALAGSVPIGAVELSGTNGSAQSETPSTPTVLELGKLLEELLANLALRGDTAPRYLFRCDQRLPLERPRTPLAEGLEACSCSPRRCAGKSGIVSVHAEPYNAARPNSDTARIRLEFPTGELKPRRPGRGPALPGRHARSEKR